MLLSAAGSARNPLENCQCQVSVTVLFHTVHSPHHRAGLFRSTHGERKRRKERDSILTFPLKDICFTALPFIYRHPTRAYFKVQTILSTGPMASAEHESITRRSLPPVGSKGRSPLLFACKRPMEAKFTPLTVSGKLSVCDVSMHTCKA